MRILFPKLFVFLASVLYFACFFRVLSEANWISCGGASRLEIWSIYYSTIIHELFFILQVIFPFFLSFCISGTICSWKGPYTWSANQHDRNLVWLVCIYLTNVSTRLSPSVPRNVDLFILFRITIIFIDCNSQFNSEAVAG